LKVILRAERAELWAEDAGSMSSDKRVTMMMDLARERQRQRSYIGRLEEMDRRRKGRQHRKKLKDLLAQSRERARKLETQLEA
jgi:hypothetical protein